MLFKKFEPLIIPPTAAYVYQISDDIIHNGAVFNINYFRKEDTLMVEKLKAYRAELEAKKAMLESPLDISEIEVKVAEYRAELIKAAEYNRDVAIAKVDSDIECINVIIAREEEAAAAVVEIETPTEIIE